jgi:hypothetical protein
VATNYREPGLAYRNNLPYRGLIPATITEDRLVETQVFLVNRQGVPIAEFDAAIIENITWELNKPGSCRFSMPVDDPKMLAGGIRRPQLLLDEVQVWLDGALLWWGVPWQDEADDTVVTIDCEGLLSYFNKIFVTNGSLQYDSMEQMLIGQRLVEYAQSGMDQNRYIGIYTYASSGHTRSRLYDRDQHQNINDLLAEFPTLSDGFDYDMVYDSTGTKVWRPYYPTKGSLKSNYVLEWGRNIISFSVPRDAHPVANRVYATGGSNGATKFENNYRDATSAASIGEFQEIVTVGGELDVNWLLERATKEVNLRKNPVTIPQITAVQVPITLLGAIEVGDTVPIRIDRGCVQVNANYRINRIVWNVEENTLTLSFQ